MNDETPRFCAECAGCALIFAFSAYNSKIVGVDSKNRCTLRTVSTLLRRISQ